MSTQKLNAKAAPADVLDDAAKVRATIREWIAAGLPDSTWIVLSRQSHSVDIIVRSAAELDVWADAVGRKPIRVAAPEGIIYSLPHDVYPVALNGWRLDVFCELPAEDTQPPPVRIKLMSAKKAAALRAATA